LDHGIHATYEPEADFANIVRVKKFLPHLITYLPIAELHPGQIPNVWQYLGYTNMPVPFLKFSIVAFKNLYLDSVWHDYSWISSLRNKIFRY